MSKWSVLRENHDVFDDISESREEEEQYGYIVHIPPPVSGPSRPASPVDIASITIISTKSAPDATRKKVIWYEVLISTISHQWCVLKRFSEFFQLYGAMQKVGLIGVVKQQLRRSIASPPSRMWLIQRRQALLDKFLKSLLQTLKDLSVIVIAGTSSAANSISNNSNNNNKRKFSNDSSVYSDFSRQTTVVVTRAAFASFIHFLTATSYDSLLENITDINTQSGLLTLGETTFNDLVSGDQGHVPPAKIVHIPRRRFTIMLQLPGAAMSDIFVESSTSPEHPREIIVGGCWNSHITGPASLLLFLSDGTDPSIPSTRSTLNTESTSLAATDTETGINILVDTFPTGEFWMRFEVPAPFVVNDWESDYAAGVLFLTWRASIISPSSRSETS